MLGLIPACSPTARPALYPGHPAWPAVPPALSGRLDGVNGDDERLLRCRVYGADPDHPGPRPGRTCVELVGDPLDGLLFL